MDKGIANRKQPSKAIGLTRSAINKDFAIAPKVVKGFRHSSIEPSSSSQSSTSTNSSVSSNFFNGRNGVSIRNSNDFYRNGNNLVNYNENNRQTVCIENPTKLYKKGYGISNDILSTTNESNNKYTTAFDKVKWTHKKPINGNFSV